MGWQFMAAEAVAAPIMVAILAVLFRLFLRPQLLQAAKLSRLCAVGHGGEAPRGSISRSPPNLPHDWKEQCCLLGFAA